MKLRRVNVVELILLGLFSAGYLFHSAHIPYSSLMFFVAGMFLGCLYWPLGFYTLKIPGVNIVYSIAAGLLFSVSVVQIIYGLLKWPTFSIIFEVIIGIYAAAILAMCGVYLFKKHKGQTTTFDKGLLIRFAVYLLYVLYAFLNYVPRSHP